MDLIIDPTGDVHGIYDDSIRLAALGKLKIRRASHVEPTSDGSWTADLSPMGGPILGPFSCRCTAIKAETRWLRQNWLTRR